MKKVFFFAVLSLAVSSAHAKIWRVNNVPGVAADFTTAQAAHDGAAANDTIYLESSPNSYGDLITTKKLTWIGLGYFLPQNPGLQYHNNAGFVSSININPGSDGSLFQINSTGFPGDFRINSCANITVQRCYIEGTVNINGTSNHITITQLSLIHI